MSHSETSLDLHVVHVQCLSLVFVIGTECPPGSRGRPIAASSRHEKRALVLSTHHVEVDEQIDYLPLYMVMFL